MSYAPASDWIFLRRVLITLAVTTIAYIAWKLADLFILLFAAVLLSVLLGGLAAAVARYSRLPSGWALAVSCVSLAALAGILLSLFGAQIIGQISGVFDQLPGAINVAGATLGIADAFKQLQEALSNEGSGQLLSRAARVGYTALGVVSDLLLVTVVAVYLAADPSVYRRGAIKLFPSEQHDRIADALDISASALRLWFLGQLASMTLVGLLCGLAFWAIGLTSPVGLGAIAGATNFIPLIGPIIGALPAVLFALTQDLSVVLWTVSAVLVIQQLEGNVITPMIQKRAVELPPALILLGLSAFGALGGMLGVILATPLTVVVMVLVQKLWIRETLGENTTIPGERRSN
ncbi:MAG: AI-2E family transporter [Bradyrhizobium sp.]|uniref:AI-2E family transporter n=1 Tax=Bradyrhizobium sp. TaxID=376 RepID=UPI00349012C0